MIKWVTVLVNKSTNKVEHVKEMGSPFRDDLNTGVKNITANNQSDYIQKSFCIECDPAINASWLLENLSDDGVVDSIPKLKSGLSAIERRKLLRQMSEADGDLDFDDRKIALSELKIEMSVAKKPLSDITDAMLLKRVDDKRAKI